MKFAKKLSALTLSAVLFGSSLVPVSASKISEISGLNRYETAAKIADNIGNYNTAILVNSDKSLADGLSASSLAGKENAPILLVKKDSIPNETMTRLQNVDKVYIIGGNAAISKNIENQLSDKEIIRIEGKNRIETSEKVAALLGGYNEAFIVNGNKGEADAMSVASVAARDKAPIILTNGNTSSQDKKSGVKYFAIGGGAVVSNNLVSKFDAKRISGNNRYETNRAVINNFYANSDTLYCAKGDPLVDALTSSLLAKDNGVVLVSSNSDNSILKGKNAIQIGGMKDIDLFGNSKPVITAKKDTVTLEFLEQLDINEFGVTAYDKEDGDLTNEILLLDPPDAIYPGTYELKLYVKDSDGAEAYKTLKLIIVESVDSGNTNVNSKEFQEEYRKEFYKLINTYRTIIGIHELKTDSGLENWAYLKSKHMSDLDYFDHEYEGKMIDEIYPDAGGNVPLAGENIYWVSGGTYTAKELAKNSFEAWRNSPGHNMNMLNESYDYVAVAAYKGENGIFMTTDFGWD